MVLSQVSVAGLVIYVSNRLVTTYGLNALSVGAAFIVSSPYLAGFTYHLITIKVEANNEAS